jgi:septal ring factor EnvC (AmiA/AmiB activator)
MTQTVEQLLAEIDALQQDKAGLLDDCKSYRDDIADLERQLEGRDDDIKALKAFLNQIDTLVSKALVCC